MENENHRVTVEFAIARIVSIGGDELLEKVMVSADRVRLENNNNEILRQGEMIANSDTEIVRLNEKLEGLEENIQKFTLYTGNDMVNRKLEDIKGYIQKYTKELNNSDNRIRARTSAGTDKNIEVKHKENANQNESHDPDFQSKIEKQELDKHDEDVLLKELCVLRDAVEDTMMSIAETISLKETAKSNLEKCKQKEEEELNDVVARNLKLKQLQKVGEELVELKEELVRVARGSEEDKAESIKAIKDEIAAEIERANKYCEEWEARTKKEWEARKKNRLAWTGEPLYAPYINEEVKKLRKEVAKIAAHAEGEAAQKVAQDKEEVVRVNEENQQKMQQVVDQAKESNELKKRLDEAEAKVEEGEAIRADAVKNAFNQVQAWLDSKKGSPELFEEFKKMFIVEQPQQQLPVGADTNEKIYQ